LILASQFLQAKRMFLNKIVKKSYARGGMIHFQLFTQLKIQFSYVTRNHRIIVIFFFQRISHSRMRLKKVTASKLGYIFKNVRF
jgi:hypothetical protein